jgi:hypothetical protein
VIEALKGKVQSWANSCVFFLVTKERLVPEISSFLVCHHHQLVVFFLYKSVGKKLRSP